VPAAAAADLGSRVNADRIRAGADAFEEEVGRRLRAGGARAVTEAAARAAAAAEGAPPPALTPDFLLARPVRINGRPVGWVDAKNYMLTDSRLTLPGLRKQAEKYVAALGPGAFVFAGGAVAGSALDAVPGLTILTWDGGEGEPTGN
jgi:hypothetical protein